MLTIVSLLVSIPLSLLRGVVFSSLWLWFVVPLGVTPIGVLWAMGLSVLVSSCFNPLVTQTTDELKGRGEGCHADRHQRVLQPPVLGDRCADPRVHVMLTYDHIDDLWHRTRIYAKRHLLADPMLSQLSQWLGSQRKPAPASQTSQIIAIAYMAGYGQRQHEDNGPTLERDAAVLAFPKPWGHLSPEERQPYLQQAMAARILIGPVYAE